MRLKNPVTVGKSPEIMTTPPVLVRAEANILRYPIFYLHTKKLSTIDMICCSGTRTVEGKTQNFRLTASRNSRFLYPGPFARKVHHALMSLLQKNGFPYANSVDFTWRQLAAEMDIAWSGGKQAKKLETAIRSIAGLLITSESALIDGETREPIQEVERGFAIIQEFVFAKNRTLGKSVGNRNRVVFSDWFIANLNQKYFATYRYDVWLQLAQESVIASRMYEYLLHAFSGNHPIVSINYSRLCQFLPITEYPTQYRAERQLNSVFDLLMSHEILNSFDWQIGTKGQMKLRLEPGPLLRSNKTRKRPDLEFKEDMTVSESHSAVSPSEELVRLFYTRWKGIEGMPVTDKEQKLAEFIIDTYGRHDAKQLLRNVIKILKVKWPDANSFMATKEYWGPAAKLQKKIAVDESNDREAKQQEARKHEQERARRQRLRQAWAQLNDDQKTEITNHVYANENPMVVAVFDSRPKIREMYLLNELERRQ